MRKLLSILTALLLVSAAGASDHVIDATHPVEPVAAPASLSLSMQEAEDLAVRQNRSLRNAAMEVQAAYAQRWQTIAAMLPNVDASGAYSNYCGYSATMTMGGMPVTINMPDVAQFSLTASVGINGQAVIGALLNTLAIDMQKISLEQSEDELRANVRTGYMTVLVLQDISALLDSSLVNIEQLAAMTQFSVEAGVTEQTTADQILVRINALRNSINSNKRSLELSLNSLRVLLAVPADTEIMLTQTLDDLLSAEAILQLLGEDFNINNNLNYQLLRKNTDLAEKNLHMAGWAYGPTVSVAYNYTKQHYFSEGGFRMTPPNLVQVNVSVPLWSSGKRAAGVVEKKIALEEARNTLAETTDQLAIQNKQLRFNLSNAYETYVNERDNIDVTRRVFASTTNKFRWGTASNLELVNASNDLISAQSTYVQAVLTLVQAQVALDKFLNNK
ncbi:MAG: TolC family protein [Paludibacteraceae bacterium]|nr:TolC family protein [Paludibacteraceae bacterium]